MSTYFAILRTLLHYLVSTSIQERQDFLCLGSEKKMETFPYELKKSLKILGVHFSYNELSRRKENFHKIYKKRH